MIFWLLRGPLGEWGVEGGGWGGGGWVYVRQRGASGSWASFFWTPIETRYECLCDQGTSYTQVAENWNVVKQRGELWVVTAKEGADAVVR